MDYSHLGRNFWEALVIGNANLIDKRASRFRSARRRLRNKAGEGSSETRYFPMALAAKELR